MAVEQNVLAAQKWFTYTDKKLRFRIFDEDGVTPLDMSGRAFVFTVADDNEGTVEFTKTSEANEIRVDGDFDIDPDLNEQYVEVDVDAEDTKILFRGRHYFSLRCSSVGFRDVLTHGYWEAQKDPGGI